MGVAIHGDGGLTVACHRRRDVCVMGFFVDICDDGVPEGVAFMVRLSRKSSMSSDVIVLMTTFPNTGRMWLFRFAQ